MLNCICFAQNIDEIQFILKKTNKKPTVIPLDLGAQLYCIYNKIEFIDPKNLIKNSFHFNTIKESYHLLNNLNYNDVLHESHQKELKAFVRFRFHLIAFLKEIVDQLKLLKKIDEIILSGWDHYYDTYSEKNYFISHIILDLVDDIKITTLNKISHKDFSDNFIYDYNLKNNLNNKEEYIFLTNLGYNFFRIVLTLFKNDKKILTPLNKISFLKKIIYNLLGVEFIEFEKKKNQKKNQIELPIIDFKYMGKDISKILNFRIDQEKKNIINLINKSYVINELFQKFKIRFVITNITRGIFGYFIDAAKNFKISSMCIPHGTLSKNFDQFDQIYKKTISEAITSKNAKFNVSQSDISKKFYEQNKNDYNKIIHTGNLIFSKSNKKKRKKRKIRKLLFAVTVKNLQSIQLLGVEMYYEFIDNLFFLDNFSKKNNFDVLIKLHPGVYKELPLLEKIFPNLEFSKKNISKIFDKSFVTISYSSTAIEDSLNSSCPVILLDRWKRYKHCNAETNVDKKNSAVYYVNNENDLLKCLETIAVSEKSNFSNFVNIEDNKKNMNSFINEYILKK